jgi:hypothetical protein|tara:strand:+ start:894 stop:1427 length:534 start_codon:yes stop_codon:yes gene_type:complete
MFGEMKAESVAKDDFGKSMLSRRKVIGLLLLAGVVSVSAVLYLFPLSTLSDDSIPDGPLSTEQIEQYTLSAFEKGYEARVKNDIDMMLEANAMFDKLIDSVIDNGFEFEKYFALRKTAFEYLSSKLTPVQSVAFEKQVRETYDRVSILDDKEEFRRYTKEGFASSLGAPRGAYRDSG